MSRNTITPLAQLIAMLVLIALTSACGSSATPAISTATSTPTITRILFIGNSLTVNNDLPGMFANLAQSGGHSAEVDVSSAGGGTWEGHARSGGATFGKINRKKWDFVVLQEQSDYPAIAALREERVYPAVRVLKDKIIENGSTPILFMTWARREGLPDAGFKTYAEMQAQVAAGYMEVATELKLMVVPVGIAWQNAIDQQPQIDLWQADGIHLTRSGTYLAACVFYAAIFKQSPIGLKYHAELPEEIASLLQAVATETTLKNPQRWNIPEMVMLKR